MSGTMKPSMKHYPDWKYVGMTLRGLDEYVCKEAGCGQRIKIDPVRQALPAARH